MFNVTPQVKLESIFSCLLNITNNELIALILVTIIVSRVWWNETDVQWNLVLKKLIYHEKGSCTGYEWVEGRSEWTKNVRYGFCFLLDAKEFFHHYWLSQGYWQEQTELPFLNFIIRLTVFDVSWTVQDLESDAKKKTLAFSFRKRFPLLPNTRKQKSFHAQFFTFQTFIHQHSAGKSKAYDFIYIFFYQYVSCVGQ